MAEICPSCGKEAKGKPGLAAHMVATHGVSLVEWREGKREGFRNSRKPTVIPYSTALERVAPTVQQPSETSITRVPNMEVVTDGVRIGIVEWQDSDD